MGGPLKAPTPGGGLLQLRCSATVADSLKLMAVAAEHPDLTA